MLDQFRQEQNESQDFAPQTNKKKIIILLSGVMLVLFGTLCVCGAFGNDDDKDKKMIKNDSLVLERFKDIEDRIHKLEAHISSKTQEFDHEQLAKIFGDTNQPIPQPNQSQPLIAFDQPADIPVPIIADLPLSHDQEFLPNTDKTKSPAAKAKITQTKQQPKPLQQSLGIKTHKVQRGDTLSIISQTYYGTPKKWRIIYEANKDKISNMNQLKVGTVLTIPEVK